MRTSFTVGQEANIWRECRTLYYYIKGGIMSNVILRGFVALYNSFNFVAPRLNKAYNIELWKPLDHW